MFAPPVAAPAPPPAPVLPPDEGPAPILPAEDPFGAPPSVPAAAASLDHQRLETTDQHQIFYSASPTHRPRVTAEWLLQNKKKHPHLFTVLASLAVLVVAGGAALSIWGVPKLRLWPPEASTTPRYQPPPPPPEPAPVVMPAETVRGKVPEEEAQAVELPREAPLGPKGATPPRGVGGRAGFEAVGAGDGDSDVRERIRQRNLTIAKKDKKLLDLLEKNQDSAPVRAAAAERGVLDTGRAALDEAAVRQTMASASKSFSACVTRALKENPGLRVDGRRATMMFTIRPSGVVKSAWIAEAELDKSPLGRCLVGAAQRLVFPAFSGEPVDVSAPLVLSTGM